MSVVAAAGAIVLWAAPVAGAAVPSPGEAEPLPAQAQAALQRAAELHREVDDQVMSLAQARGALEASAADASVALESAAQAAAIRDAAVRQAAAAEDALRAAQETVDAERAGLARWARAAYVDGGSLGSSPGIYTLLAGGSTDDVGTARTWLERAGLDRARVLERVRSALAAQLQAAARSRHCADVAEATAAQAAAASAARDAVLAAHRSRLADLEAMLAGSRDAAQRADVEALRLAAVSAGGAAESGQVAAGAVTGEVGDCPGQDISGYANGMIPVQALCPVWGAPGALFRADAAFAFSRLSQAFAARFGSALCVTDSYRSFQEQVRVRAGRGSWAAVPGHSRHGWGTAADLCGGVESFGSPAHAWMTLHAPLFGWFHPAWAEPGGSLPEPWHWEYAGEGR